MYNLVVYINIMVFIYIYKTQNGNTALIWASFKGHADIVTLLLSDTNIDVNIQDKVSIYMLHI